MCIMKSEYTLIKGNGSIMYIMISLIIKKHPTLIFFNHQNSPRSGDITKTIILPIFTMANLFYANYDNNSLYQLF